MPGILIVDDLPSQSLTVALPCRSLGVQSPCAATTTEAFAIIEQVSPNAAIIDLVTPGADGFDCLFMISKLAPAMAVAVTTASDILLLKAAAELTDGYGLKHVALMQNRLASMRSGPSYRMPASYPAVARPTTTRSE